MTIEPKPEGYIYASIPKGPRASAAKAAKAKVTQTVKSAMQEYLERYLGTNGIYREQLKLTADFSVQYETRLSAPQEDDPTIYDLQLARYWQELRQRLPCILIIDAGFNYINPGLGGIAGSNIMNRSTSSVIMKMDCSIPIKLSVAAMDETTCQDIRDILVYIFGTLTNFNQGYLIRSRRPEDTWEVRLPLNFDPEGLENRKVTEDNKDSLWTTGIELTPEFEGTIVIGFEKQVQAELYKISVPGENDTLKEKAAFLGACYAFGAKAYKESEEAQNILYVLQRTKRQNADEETTPGRVGCRTRNGGLNTAIRVQAT